jgi:hypothetical protein
MESSVNDVGLLWVSSMFPSPDHLQGRFEAGVRQRVQGSVAREQPGVALGVRETKGPDNILSSIWNQKPDKDILYVCMGPSFNAGKPLEICAIPNMPSGMRSSSRRRGTSPRATVVIQVLAKKLLKHPDEMKDKVDFIIIVILYMSERVFIWSQPSCFTQND